MAKPRLRFFWAAVEEILDYARESLHKLSEEEVEAITDHLRTLGTPDYIDEDIFFDEDEEPDYAPDEDDPLMDRALEIVFNAGKASASFLQRRLKIGYSRAARLIDQPEQEGIVGPFDGSKARKVLYDEDSIDSFED